MAESDRRVIIENAAVPIAMFDRQMRFLAASRRWCENFGLGERDVIGRVLYETVPDIPARWKDNHRRALAGETLRQDDDPHHRADGRIQWRSWEVRPWYRLRDEIAASSSSP